MRSIALFVALLAPLAARAGDDQDTEIAKRHFNYGKELYAAQRYEEAIVEFESARTVKPLPAFDYNIALCHDRLEQLEPAIAAYRRFIAATKNPAERVEPSARVRVLEERLASGKVPAPPHRSLVLAIAVGGVAVASVLVGAILLGTVNSDYNGLQASCAPLCARSAGNDLETRADVGYALLAIGAVAAAADVVLWVVARRAPRPSDRAWLSPTGRGFAVGGRF